MDLHQVILIYESGVRNYCPLSACIAEQSHDQPGALVTSKSKLSTMLYIVALLAEGGDLEMRLL